MSDTPLPISFLSDYGYADELAGVCRGVIASIAPAAALIDLTHGVPPGDVRRGALALADAVVALPAGVHLAVVDPGVGTSRRPVAVRAPRDGRLFVGPDNGLLWPAIERCGGAVEAVDLSDSRFRAPEVSATFHGRDIFAPVAAHLALGAALAGAGSQVAVESLARPPLSEPILADDHAVAHVLYADRFGNAALDIRGPDFLALAGDSGEIEVWAGERRVRARLARAFGDVAPGDPLVYVDSNGRVAIAINRGNAAAELGVEPDDQVSLHPL